MPLEYPKKAARPECLYPNLYTKDPLQVHKQKLKDGRIHFRSRWELVRICGSICMYAMSCNETASEGTKVDVEAMRPFSFFCFWWW